MGLWDRMDTWDLAVECVILRTFLLGRVLCRTVDFVGKLGHEWRTWTWVEGEEEGEETKLLIKLPTLPWATTWIGYSLAIPYSAEQFCHPLSQCLNETLLTLHWQSHSTLHAQSSTKSKCCVSVHAQAPHNVVGALPYGSLAMVAYWLILYTHTR